MGLLNRARAAAAAFRATGQVEKTFGAQMAWFTIFGAGLDNFFGADSLTQPFAQHPATYAAVKAIASGLGALPLEMFPDSDKKHERPIKNSRVLGLLKEPNDDMTLAQLLEGTYTSLELWGDAFWFMDALARTSAESERYPTRLYLWEASRVRRFTKTDGSRWYEYNNGTEVKQVPAASVIRFYFYNPYDLERGLAPLQAATVIANADYKAGIWNRAVFDNAAIPYGLITPKLNQITDKDAMVRVRDQIEQRHQGAAKRGRLGAVNVALEFLELGMSHKDMDFPLLLDAATERILMVFRVPPTVAGVSKNANYQEATRQAKQFWANHLPTAQYVEAIIKRRLCDAFGIKETPFFKTESIKALIEDQESLSNQARNYWNMGVPFDQINERMELGFDPKGHIALETSWGPFSLVDMDQQAMVDPAAAGPQRGPRPGEEQNQPGDESTVADDPTEGKAAKTVDNREWNRSLNWRALISKVRNEEMMLIKRLREHFFYQRTEVLANLRTATETKAAPKPAEFSVELVMFDEEKSAQDLRRRSAAPIRSAAEKGIQSILAELRLVVDFETVGQGVQQFLQDKAFEIVDLVDGPVADRLRATLQDGLAKGETVDQIADRVEETFKVERARAERIARTEIAESFNAGRFETMKEAGVQKIEWLTARDSRVRETHAELDGDIVVVGDRFANGLLYPLDPAGPPEEIVNCRCVALPAA